MTDCEVCGRGFGTSDRLKQHVTDSILHSPDHLTLCCLRCTSKPFTTKLARQQHLLSSPKHRVCKLCPEHWDFETKKQLKHHFKIEHPGQSVGNAQLEANSLIEVTDFRTPHDATNEASRGMPPEPHVQGLLESESAPATPLDRFFLSYATFRYDASLPPTASFEALIRHCRWKRGTDELRDARAEYQRALRQEVDVWFGREDDIGAWHTLCRAVGIRRPPSTIEECTQVLRNTHVNIVDLIDWGRNRAVGSVQVFQTRDDLVEYSREHAKIFPVKEVQANGETNVVLRHLLRRFRTRHSGVARAQLAARMGAIGAPGRATAQSESFDRLALTRSSLMLPTIAPLVDTAERLSSMKRVNKVE
ncbi:hypothetical protein HYQ44_005052 [Verticillium longisporum]|nr:hypothetical protein HYQ44_005052 [Verticillium longisporum]